MSPRLLLSVLLVLAVAVGAAGCRPGGRGSSRVPGVAGEAGGRAGEAARRAAVRPDGGGGARPEAPLPGALAVVVDNNPAARPQAGLERADLVYELPAEGGITRYLAVFASRPVPRVGPVRSARPYLVELARAYGTPLVHAGGSDDAYRLLARLGLPHLDEIRNAGELFARDRSRRAPHNLYTSSDRLLAGMRRRGWTPPPLPPPAEGDLPVPGGSVIDTDAAWRADAPGGDDALPHGGDAPGGSRVTITYADTAAFRYTTGYRWDGRGYIKEVDGRTAVSETGRPLRADTVVIVATRVRQTGDALGHVQVDLTGGGEAVAGAAVGGEALVLRGGRVHAGRWFPGRGEPFAFQVDGFSFSRLRGVTWVNVVGSLAQVRLDGGTGRD